MKKTIFIIYFISLCSCTTDNKKNRNNGRENLKNIIEKTEQRIDYTYVIAKSGLNYRTEPNGDVIGKFKFGNKLNIIKNTGITKYIYDNGYIIKEEWLGIESQNDTVYTFGGYLSKDKGINIYKSKKRLRYLYYSNGGLIGYFSDGTITGCARCDPDMSNISSMYTSQTTGRTYTVNDRGELLEENNYSYDYGDGPTIIKPIEVDEYGAREWGIINYKEVF
ncbi:SH3 domain-containing protein [Cellulophaga sp. Z1A5H]|uniref:SH3 domain-containing protein n=1 Tax=Cellulophaga sp. Z1A5H TaxID=2687291 RepID=UPI0013FDE3EF|nr:SH3 domain-containing protein [Cellulophaga sp. Z1A5H]